MALYTKRSSNLTIRTKNLRDEEGELIPELEVGETIEIVAGSSVVSVTLSKDHRGLDVEVRRGKASEKHVTLKSEGDDLVIESMRESPGIVKRKKAAFRLTL